MKNKKHRALLAILFLIGLAILLYPVASNKWNEYRAHRLISDYETAVESLGEDEYDEHIEKAAKYNKSLIGSEVPDAFSIREGIRDMEYEKLLNIAGSGIIGHIDIPRMDVDIPVYHYTFDDVLEKGAGHLFGSSLPVGGESTHTVITAHRGLPSAKLFTDLDLMEVGDCFIIHVLNEELIYEVDSIETVKPTETESLVIRRGKDLATLITCTPYSVNTHRLMVHAHRTQKDSADVSSGVRSGSAEASRFIPFLICVLIGVALAIVAVKVGLFSRRRAGNEKREEKK